MKKTIKELDIYISDGNYSSKYPRSEEFVEEGIPFIRGNNMVDGDITDDEMYYITPEKHSLLLKGHVKAGDVLITTRGNIGQVAIVPDRHEDSNINAQIVLLRTNQETLYNRYLLWALQSHGANEQYLALQTGTALKQLPVGKLEKLFIEVTDINKQHEIADILDKTYEVVKLRRKELQLLDDLTKARFVEMFGDPKINPFNWNVVNISQIVSGKVSNGFFARRDDYCDDGNVGVLGVANIVNRMYSKIEELPRTNANDEDIKKFEVKYGDMLFCRSSLVAEGIGKASIIPKNIQRNILFECHVIRLPLDLKICIPEFIQTLSTMNFFRNQIIAQSKTATMTTIGQDGILKADIILPPIEKQKDFYNFVHQVDKLKLLSPILRIHIPYFGTKCYD